MSVEQRPLTNLSKQETSIKSKLSAIGALKSSLSTFQSAVQALGDGSKFQAFKVSSSDSSIVSASASSNAAPGTYSLEVSKLAQAQKLASAGQASSSVAIGTGVITFDFGTINLGETGTFDSDTGKYSNASFQSSGAGTKTVKIDTSNNSLAGIRDAINNAGIGVTAAIINDGGTNPHRLVLTQQTTGKASSMKISVEGDGPLAALLSHNPAGAPVNQAFSETITAQNAELKVDGIVVSKPSNTITDMIAGATLTLNKTNAGSPTSITVARDTAGITTAVGQFVTAFNQVNQTLKNVSSYNADTKQAAALNGDSTVRIIQTQLRSLLTSPVAGNGTYTLLPQIGVSLQKDGTLAVDNDKLQKAISSNPADIAGLFSAVGRTTDSLVSYTGSTDKTAPGTYALNVTQLATQGKTVGQGVANLTIDSSNDRLEVKLDGNTATVTLSHGTYANADALIQDIQAKINGASAFSGAGSTVSVSQAGGVITLTSARYGSASNISISGGNGKAGIIGASPTIVDGLNVAGTINGAVATGSGQYLTGAEGNPAEGLKLQITGTTIGDRGTVSYTKGYAYQFQKLATTLLGEDGVVASRINGINDSLKRIDQQRERINDRLAETEKRYRAQFTALDVLLSNMTQTSNYLAQQLANLPTIE
ncbi:hypothetical protein ASE07_13285 [Noviherbaspirillum sp. Root189]|nr:hypothetical protein ASE07_13285 [Noviherbaspirillum sp. Root189]